jgi:ParB family transcriptional regulator, chromosome partitioning protein
MNKTMKKFSMEIELHYIDLPFEPLRRKRSITSLLESMDTQEQIMPVIVVPSSESSRFTLIDGYARVRTIKKLAHDTVIAEVWECSISEALLWVLADQKNYHLSAIEEAFLLKTLLQSGITVTEIAHQTGKHRSWVSRRLLLVEALPHVLQQALLAGYISAWTALRVLLPVARATPEIIEQLLEYLKNNPCSTRQLKLFFEHYQHANKTIRADMLNTPESFFKTVATQEAKQKTQVQFPCLEAQWQEHLNTIHRLVKKLIQIVPNLFSSQQSLAERGNLLQALERVNSQINVFRTTVQEVLNACNHNTK